MTIDFRFRSGLDGSHSIIFSLGKSFMLKEFIGNPRYTRRSIAVYKYTFYFETARLGLVTCKESRIYKMAIVQFTSFAGNGAIIVWFTIPAHIITLMPPCRLILATGKPELDKIFHLAHLSGSSNITWDSSVKINLEKSIFMYFLAQFCRFKIFSLVRRGCLKDFYRYCFTKYSTLFILLDSPNSRLFIWAQVKRSSFAITHFRLSSSCGSKFFKRIPCIEFSTSLYFQRPSLSFDDLCKIPLISLKWIFPHSVSLSFSIFQ